MSITADFHMHSSHSGDGNTPMEEMIRQALNTGLTHLCFTEHQDLTILHLPICLRIIFFWTQTHIVRN